jgi:RNA polymerase sigma factor (sigma-70 family)
MEPVLATDPSQASIEAGRVARTGDHAASTSWCAAPTPTPCAGPTTGLRSRRRARRDPGGVPAGVPVAAQVPRAQFSTRLYRITANCAATSWDAGRHQHEALDEEATVYDTTPEHDPAAVADAAHLRERLEDAIADLPPRLRAVVVLRDIYDMNHAEIAEELGISESAAKVRLHRARRKLRTQVFPLRGEAPLIDGEEHAHAV